ncbi:hypothetical protein H6M51_12490 [Rhizobium sp. AQ_MP]|uniref:hypothetical protein n=1 Tax=Rhizobium sp. AQ_MP TaxID=2761536 RepID=UPI00163A8C82|nr:hypothetical protein [Rhizobium sp. AQ_MP]MBC2773684.1 hypothetical protein [Rhizobium sp. AQ_MP]
MSIVSAQGIMAKSKEIAGAEMATTTGEKIQKVSTVFALSMIAAIALLFVYAAVRGYLDSRAEKEAAAKTLTDLERIEASDAPPSVKSREWLELAYSSPGAMKASLSRYSEGHLLALVNLHLSQGYNQSDPLPAAIIEKVAEAKCLVFVRQVDMKSPTFNTDNYSAYLQATAEIGKLQPHLMNYEASLASCTHRFQVMQQRHEKRIAEESARSTAVRDVGAALGNATKEAGEWWSSTTKPIANAVDEFKAGYESGK